jgi:sortase (surface protein transpeptidase)
MRATLVVGLLAASLIAGCAASSPTATEPSVSAPATIDAPATTAPAATVQPTAAPTPTLKPTPSPTPMLTPDVDGTATRIAIPALHIDLPVVEVPAGYPYCGVAMSLTVDDKLVLPGRQGATYILAHPRRGLFKPILDASQVNDGKAMVGMAVDVYTSRNWRFTYAVTAVHRHVDTGRHALDGPLAATGPELWLQTGEGPRGTRTALLVSGNLATATPVDQAEAQPSAKPVVCG